MNASVCAPELSGFCEARGCQLAAGLLPPAPLARAPVPPPFPRSPLPGGPGAGTPRRSRRRRQRVGEPRAPRCRWGPSRAAPAPARPRRPSFPPGHALSNFVAAAAAAASGAGRPAGGREGRAPGRSRAARGSESGGPGPRPHHAPARRRRRRGRRRRRRLGRRGGRRRGRPRGQRRADPLPGRGGRGAGAEQRQRLGAAGPGRSQVVPGQRVGEPEQQLGLGGEEASAAAPGDPSPALAHPPSPLCLLRRRRGVRSPPGTLSRSRGTISPKVSAGPGSPHSRPRGARRLISGRSRYPLPPWPCPCSPPLSASAVLGCAWGALGSPVPTPGPQPRRCPGDPDLTPSLVLPAVRRPHDGAFFKGPPYPGYPFLMIPDLSSPYLPNGPLSPGGARTVSARPAAPGRVGGRGPRDAPPGSATGWGMGDGAVP